MSHARGHGMPSSTGIVRLPSNPPARPGSLFRLGDGVSAAQDLPEVGCGAGGLALADTGGVIREVVLVAPHRPVAAGGPGDDGGTGQGDDEGREGRE